MTEPTTKGTGAPAWAHGRLVVNKTPEMQQMLDELTFIVGGRRRNGVITRIVDAAIADYYTKITGKNPL